MAGFAIKNLKDAKEILGESRESEKDSFTIEFEKNNAQAPVLFEELEKD